MFLISPAWNESVGVSLDAGVEAALSEGVRGSGGAQGCAGQTERTHMGPWTTKPARYLY